MAAFGLWRLLRSPHAAAAPAALAAILRHADPDRCTGCGLFHLIEALWRGFCQAEKGRRRSGRALPSWPMPTPHTIARSGAVISL